MLRNLKLVHGDEFSFLEQQKCYSSGPLIQDMTCTNKDKQIAIVANRDKENNIPIFNVVRSI